MHRNIPVVAQLMAAIAERGCPQFASFTYEAQPKGTRLSVERARHVVLLGASFEEMYKRDVTALEALIPTLSGLEREGAEKLVATRRQTLVRGFGNNEADTHSHAYTSIGCDGLKVHLETGDIHVMGLKVSKVTLVPATYRTVNSRPETIAKDKVAAMLPSARIRQFNLSNRTTVKIDGQTLEFGD